jgi:hypothetical protein
MNGNAINASMIHHLGLDAPFDCHDINRFTQLALTIAIRVIG